MDVTLKRLYKTIMRYFDGLDCHYFDHVPHCTAWIDRIFEGYAAINFIYGRRMLWSVKGQEPFFLNAGTCFWTWPGPHWIYGAAKGESWDHFYLTFRGPRLKKMLAAGLLPLDPQRAYKRVDDPQRFRETWDEVFRLLKTKGHRDPKAIHLLEGMLLSLHEAPNEGATPDSLAGHLSELGRQVRADPRRAWNSFSEAKRLHISEVHFRREFKRAQGSAFNQYVLQARMDEAARVLRAEGLPLKQAAEAAGYDDLYYFSKLFKKRYGVPPGQYRDTAMR